MENHILLRSIIHDCHRRIGASNIFQNAIVQRITDIDAPVPGFRYSSWTLHSIYVLVWKQTTN
jgi:hypothetical protein